MATSSGRSGGTPPAESAASEQGSDRPAGQQTAGQQTAGAGPAEAPSVALARGFTALVTALEEGFRVGQSNQLSVNRAGETVTEQGGETLFAVAPRVEPSEEETG